MIDANNLSVSFAGTTLFSEVSFKLISGNKVGLIGKNGAGKSTLLHIIAGKQEYSGTLAIDKETKIGLLKQDIDFQDGRSILEETYLAFTGIKNIETSLEKVNRQLALEKDYESEKYNQLLHRLDDLTHRYKALGGYTYQADTERILQGLGFQRTEFEKSTETLSGGWRMRIELAKLLLQKNDILLLDEPTNHLDIDSILWFENFLQNYSGIVILVSHDRMFLDNVTNRTIEISLGKIYDFKKTYSSYMAMRKELINKQLQTQKNQEKQIKQTEQLIEKFRYKASKAAFAQSLIKKLDKIERIQVDAFDEKVMNVRFPEAKPPGKILFTLHCVSKNYGAKKVIETIDLIVARGDRIAFVGQNGMGKTTLAKILVGEIPFEGNVEVGHNVKIGYFAQNQREYLNEENSLLEEMEEAANDENRMKVRTMLGSFLFGEEAVEKKVKVLSGGERSRLALCKMLLTPFNVLIMDEPTNHLDMLSKKVLKNALRSFEGSLILVSHDRYFLQGLVHKVYEFRQHKIKEYLGDIDYYLEQRKFENFREVEMQSSHNKPVKTSSKFGKEKEKTLKQIRNKIRRTENNITAIEKKLAEWDNAITLNDTSVIEQPDFFTHYQAQKDNLDKLLQEWSALHEQLPKS